MDFRQRKRSTAPELNVTSLVDVIFILLIFFMLTTSFSQSAGLDVDLPEAASSTAQGLDENVGVIVIGAGGEIRFNEDVMSDENLEETLKQWQEMHGDRSELVIQADEQAPHGAVVRVLDAAQGATITKVSIGTRAS